jgi:hypothetical protein
MQDEGQPSWERFKELCHLQFGPPVCGSRLAEPGHIQFHSTVQDYTDRFNVVLCHARNLDSSQKADLYVGGLPDHIRVDVELRAHRDLPTAVYLTRTFELHARSLLAQRPPETSRFSRQSHPVQAARLPLPPPVPPAGGAPLPGAQQPAAQPPIRQFRRLTPTEQLERRRQGLCYNCDEPFVRGHQCKRLFYLESDDYADNDTPPPGPRGDRGRHGDTPGRDS